MLTDFLLCPQQLLLALTEKNECPRPYGMVFEGGEDLFYIPVGISMKGGPLFCGWRVWEWGLGESLVWWGGG